MYAKLPRGYLTKSTAIIVSTGVLGYVGVELATGSENFYEKVVGCIRGRNTRLQVMPLVWRYTDGEEAHKWAVKACNWGLLPRYGWNKKEYPELECQVGAFLRRNQPSLPRFSENTSRILLDWLQDSIKMEKQFFLWPKILALG